MSVRRGVVTSVVLTLSFHIATLVFACMLAIFFTVSVPLLLLVMGYMLAGSSQFARKLMCILWRTEMAVDALVVDKNELEPVLRRRVLSVTGQRAADAAELQQLEQGEVTVPVILLSLLYFFVFKWILDLIFSGVPLILWIVSIAQVLPTNAGLSDVNIVSTVTTPAQVVTALAFAVLAHQLGVTSAKGLVFVSRNVMRVLVLRCESENTREQQTHRSPIAAQMNGISTGGVGTSSNYGTMDGKHVLLRQGDDSTLASTHKPSAETSTRNLYQDGRNASESNVNCPRMRLRDMKQQPARVDGLEFPCVPPRMHPPLPPSQDLPRAERAFQNERHKYDCDQDRELEMCCCKIVIKPNAKVRTGSEDRSDSQHRGGGRDRCGGRGSSIRREGLRWGRGGGRVGLRFDRMRPDMRGPPPLPPSNGEFPPWTTDSNERWLQHWSGRQDWQWSNRRRRGKNRRGMRRRNSFDDVYAVGIPVVTTVYDAEGNSIENQAAHKSMYEALDLTPSAPLLPSHRPRRGRYGAHWERSHGDPDHHDHDSMRTSLSEPGDRHPLLAHWHRDVEDDFDLDGDEDDVHAMERLDSNRGIDDDAVYDMLCDHQNAHQRSSEMQDTFRQDLKRANTLSRTVEHAGGEMADHVEWKQAAFYDSPGPNVRKFHQSNTGCGQIRNEWKIHENEQKLLSAQRKTERRCEESASFQERSVEAKECDRFAKEIEAASEVFIAPGSKQGTNQKRLQSPEDAKSSPSCLNTSTATPVPTASLASSSPLVPSSVSACLDSTLLVTPSEDPRKRALSSRVRGRPSPLSDNHLHTVSNVSVLPDRVEYNEREDKRSVSIARISQAGSTHDISDIEILGRYGNIARSYEDDDVTNMRVYVPLTYTESPPRYITALNPSPLYRGPSEQWDYDSFSPIHSPGRSGVIRDSFEDDHDYDLLSPTNSIYDVECSTDKFKQIYRSIQMAAEPEPRRSASTMAAEEGGLDAVPEFKGIPGRRDRVNFSAFAPPSVCPSSQPFQFTVWAFLLNQRFEMQELAKSDHPESRKLSLETKLNVRRGALVHVTIEVPNGFEVLNDVTQGFAWEGEISNVSYDVICTDGAAFGRVLFKARITVGSSVAVLNAFVLVGSRALDPSELEADVLEGWMDVMEQTYREIPFQSLKIKELVGQGYFGDAYRASLDGHDVVVKTIRASEFGESTSQIVREFQHEAAMLNMFGHHPCIVPFVGASTDTKFPLALVTKYLPYGSLEDNLRGNSSLSVDERTGMLKDAAAGLLNIHEGGFIHRDLAARNCLVDRGNHVRICDFGLCRRVRSETAGMLMKDAVGPVKYMAPESLQPPHAFSYDSDVYMFGVLMWETYTSSTPFSSLTPVEAMMHVLRGERLPIPKELPESLQTLMQSCFLDSPAERPSMQEVLTALNASLVSSQHASVAIAARTTVATAATTSTAVAKSVASWTNLHKEQDRSIWV